MILYLSLIDYGDDDFSELNYNKWLLYGRYYMGKAEIFKIQPINWLLLNNAINLYCNIFNRKKSIQLIEISKFYFNFWKSYLVPEIFPSHFSFRIAKPQNTFFCPSSNFFFHLYLSSANNWLQMKNVDRLKKII